ncbi:PREDICTED: uncharacterized protein LOC105556367 [Vollenhovia emeryi]|uniref:uncharacterized protein LOC105556367 n=1 Tax=Vollenhovia emeryi TaxID=411798 RepID=UPI0005F45548|nr:PREDICTED: uncharacterized protein LOC105556367 [Vollenhovia emeryi]
MNDCAIRLPSEDDKWLTFNNYNCKERVPFVVYADLECTLEKMDKDSITSRYAYQHHEVFSVGYYVRCSYDDSLSTYQSRRDKDCITWFVEQLKVLSQHVKEKLSNNVPMENLSKEQWRAYRSATHCHICQKPFALGDDRVRDHCHLTGRYRGPAHSNCIAEKSDWRNRMKLRFIDSYKFLTASLDKLASLLSMDNLKITRSNFSKLSMEDFNLLTRKGVFPYEYVDFVEKLEDACLPPRESFYSSLTGDTVSENDYAHAANVWRRFAIQSLGKYSDLYLKTDVMLLADIFENFRDKFMFIERSIRGGLSQCSGKYAQANNKYMHSHDPSKASSYLMYFDVNNLYGWAMCQLLPYAEFRWVDDVADFDFSAIASDSPTGYILEVDLEYPQSIHDEHTDLPFCPTRDKPPGMWQAKLLATLYCKKRYVIHYRNLQQCTRQGLRVTNIHRVLQFAQSAWLRDYIELNTQFRTLAKNDFEKNLYKLMNNAVFGKTMCLRFLQLSQLYCPRHLTVIHEAQWYRARDRATG